MNKEAKRVKIKRWMMFFAAMAILGFGGGLSIILIGNQLVTTIIGCTLFALGVASTINAVRLGLKLVY